MERIYFDHNASTPLDPEVLDAMMPYLTACHGNAASIHFWGRQLRRAVDDAREQVAALLGCEPREVIFTSGGTEANNIALLGSARASDGKRRRIVTTPIEHSSVSQPCKALATEGYEVVTFPVGADGCVSEEAARPLVDGSTHMVTAMLANNEVGSVQPVAALAALAKEHGALVHTDAVQAPGKLQLDVRKLGVDFLSMGGHKFNGPHGIGALYARKGAAVERVLFGADHERNLRPGTPNVAAIVGFGTACRLVGERGPHDACRMAGLTARLQSRLLFRIPDSAVNGPDLERRMPNTLNLLIRGVEAESLLLSLDMKGVAVSAGSACHAGGVEPSGVLLAMGLGRTDALSSLRISLGRSSTEAEVDRFCEILEATVAEQRDAGKQVS